MKIIATLFAGLVALTLVGAGASFFAFRHYAQGLPDYRQLADYDPPTVTRVLAGDGRLLAEYATEKRVFVPIGAIPQLVKDAFLSAEDKTFYSHPGIDFLGLAHAIWTNLVNLGSDRRPVGASTITQQVAKNFLLTNEVSIARKVKEAILAFRIEETFSKDRILELYLNEIYLGGGSYGVAAAALDYFNKSMDELTIAEAAYLAALPKAPNTYHMLRNPEGARERRNWVISRMAEDGRITAEQSAAAKSEPLNPRGRTETEAVTADYFAEEVRREIAQRFGDQALYEGGLYIRTSLDPRLQSIAERALRNGLVEYDRRHGWRGPLGHVTPAEDWINQIAEVPPPKGLHNWNFAMVLSVDAKGATIGVAGGATGRIPFAEMAWAKPSLPDQETGPEPKSPAQILKPGDLIAVEALPGAEDEAAEPGPQLFALRQIPDVGGAFVAMDPHTGRVLAMVGGWSYGLSEFNRATQALRQPGSAFKPFVYLTALDNGFTPSSVILDAPFVIEQGPDLPKWKPSNYTEDFLGPATLRAGLEKSRNLMTVRLAQAVGMDKIAATAEALGIFDDMLEVLAMSLGAGETTLVRLTAAYGMLVNGGKRIEPTLIDRTQDKRGTTIYRHDARICEPCRTEYSAPIPPQLPDTRAPVADPLSAFQIVHMLEGVVERGTGTKVKAVGKPLAGKTGTSNDSVDNWFIGFSPDLVAGIFIGFDQPRTLGPKETGGATAAPVFRDFMKEALADQPAIPFRIPPNLSLARVNPQTGLRAKAGEKAIWEAFKPGTEPSEEGTQQVLTGFGETATVAPGTVVAPSAPAGGAEGGGTGGLY
ncbi:MAG TPA: penicillin-binding protein 1A [Alphaproteobacteria bacterium]|nr:penicillin-binding protein 1A [Alphaproteobacteria bacterium]